MWNQQTVQFFKTTGGGTHPGDATVCNHFVLVGLDWKAVKSQKQP